MAGTRVKYPMRMMHNSVAMFFMMDQLSLLRPGQERKRMVSQQARMKRGISSCGSENFGTDLVRCGV